MKIPLENLKRKRLPRKPRAKKQQRTSQPQMRWTINQFLMVEELAVRT